MQEKVLFWKTERRESKAGKHSSYRKGFLKQGSNITLFNSCCFRDWFWSSNLSSTYSFFTNTSSHSCTFPDVSVQMQCAWLWKHKSFGLTITAPNPETHLWRMGRESFSLGESLIYACLAFIWIFVVFSYILTPIFPFLEEGKHIRVCSGSIWKFRKVWANQTRSSASKT